MNNYIPARLSRLADDTILMPAEDEQDYNPEIEQGIEDMLMEVQFENEIYERSEGFEL